ncbi:ParB N-terminal domain-containing protein [Pikeienuella piscinae]|uniref:ParB N-terminal domain-containing protein n=1 Tax=Pikeienuella piscinae TaxID=2748098 RepID=A0A7L5BX22_9RHOB|nr:ParB/RepB/Spo0J family partition protein [Pikeienuella piscinae]QIE54139.1 ParB N-terminal domain-containing protein [Pikeienuella piscinae]
MAVADPPHEEATHLIPIGEIDPDRLLLRDRITKDAPAMEELINAILRSGLRSPIEVFKLSQARPPHVYGLVSGFRRLGAFRLLTERSGADIWKRIPAFLRQPESEQDMLRRIVEENDVRRDVSPWEKARVAVSAADRGYFESVESAVDALYSTASPMKRSRIRAATRAVILLDDYLADPWRLSERQCARIAAAAERENFGEAMQVALIETKERNFEGQWRLIEPLIAESERPRRATATPMAEGRPRRVLRARRTLTVRRERTRDGYSLHFTGKLAEEGLIEDVLDDIERKFAPAPAD